MPAAPWGVPRAAQARPFARSEDSWRPPTGTTPRRDAARLGHRDRLRTGLRRPLGGPLARVRPAAVGEEAAGRDLAAHRYGRGIGRDRQERARARLAGALRLHGGRREARSTRARPARDAGAVRGVRGELEGRRGRREGGAQVAPGHRLDASRCARRRVGRHARDRVGARGPRARRAARDASARAHAWDRREVEGAGYPRNVGPAAGRVHRVDRPAHVRRQLDARADRVGGRGRRARQGGAARGADRHRAARRGRAGRDLGHALRLRSRAHAGRAARAHRVSGLERPARRARGPRVPRRRQRALQPAGPARRGVARVPRRGAASRCVPLRPRGPRLGADVRAGARRRAQGAHGRHAGVSRRPTGLKPSLRLSSGRRRRTISPVRWNVRESRGRPGGRDAMRARGIAVSLLLLVTISAAPARSETTLNVASPTLSTTPSAILLVGRDAAGNPDPSGEFVVEIRNLANQPMSGALVQVYLGDCTAVRIASSGYPEGTTATCGADLNRLVRLTDANGRATFTVPGTAVPGARQDPSCVQIFANGVPLNMSVHVATADLDGSSGVGANDIAQWLVAYGAADPSLGDLDGNGSLGANDLSIMLVLFGSGLDVATPSPLCP